MSVFGGELVESDGMWFPDFWFVAVALFEAVDKDLFDGCRRAGF